MEEKFVPRLPTENGTLITKDFEINGGEARHTAQKSKGYQPEYSDDNRRSAEGFAGRIASKHERPCGANC